MSLLDLFKRNKKSSASIAKERLQIIVAHESNRRQSGSIRAGVDLQELKRKLIDLIADHLKIPAAEVRVELEHDQDRSILELNVVLPDRV